LEAISKRNIKATMQVGGQLTHTTITQVLHVPKMKNNLILVSNVTTLALRSEPRQRGYKVEGQEEAHESHHILPGV
jgi:hypothetical protein